MGLSLNTRTGKGSETAFRTITGLLQSYWLLKISSYNVQSRSDLQKKNVYYRRYPAKAMVTNYTNGTQDGKRTPVV